MKQPIVRSLSVFAVIALLLAAIAGTASARVPDAPEADARVKVAHFAPFASDLADTAVTIKVNGSDALNNFRFGDITDYIPFAPGSYTIEVYPAGSSTAAISGTVNLSADTDYTLAAIGNGSEQPLELFPMVDDSMAPVSGAKLRVGHLAPFAANLMDTEVDICTDDGSVVLDNVPYKAVTGYLPFPAGDYDLMIAAPDDTCGTVFLDIPSVRLMDGEVADAFAIGDISNQPLQIASGTGLNLTPPARVNVAHFAPFASNLADTSVTVQVNGSPALENFEFGDITGYLEFEPGSYDIEVIPTGTSTVAISGTVMLSADTDYTLAAIGNGSLQPLELFALVDDNTPPASGAVLRVGHLAPFAANLMDTEVDICTDDGAVVLDNVPYKGVTGYLPFPAGDYDLMIAAPDDTCSTVFLDIPSVRLMDGEVADVFAIGDIANQPLQIASGTGINLTPARVNVAHLAPFASLENTGVTVQVNGTPALENFQFGEITGYLDFAPGSYDIEIIPNGASSPAITGTVMVEGGKDYTLAAVGNGSLQPLDLLALEDDNTAPASGANLRIGHLAPFAANLADTEVDICTDDGSVVAGLTNVPYGAVTGYLPLPAGMYDLKITAAGSSCGTTIIDIPSFNVSDGQVGSLFAIGDGVNIGPRVTSTPELIYINSLYLPFVGAP